MAFPSDTYKHNVTNDCFRISVARVLDVHPKTVRFIKPGQPEFWKKWETYIYDKYGLIMNINHPVEIDGEMRVRYTENRKWIAIVPSRMNKYATHAIVMDKEKLDFEPNHKHKTGFKRAPRVVNYGVTFHAS